MRDAGFRVVVATRVREFEARIRAEGFELYPLRWRRRGDGLFGGLRALAEIVRLYGAETPDIVHHVALKSVVFGSLAALLRRVPHQINMLNGLGFVFVSRTPRALVLRSLLLFSLKVLVNRKNSTVIIQNREDGVDLTRRRSISAERFVLVPGSGVDLKLFCPTLAPSSEPVVVAMVSRMLRYKGVYVLIDAAREIRRRKLPIRILLVGPVDLDNPSSVTEEELRHWQHEGIIEWLGATDNVPEVWASSHIAVLPSWYREGVPKSLLEAAACGRPIVTTDIPGCRDVVDDGVNGFIVPRGEWEPLAAAIIKLAADPTLRARMGRAGRQKMELQFDETIIVSQMLAIYRGRLGELWPG